MTNLNLSFAGLQITPENSTNSRQEVLNYLYSLCETIYDAIYCHFKQNIIMSLPSDNDQAIIKEKQTKVKQTIHNIVNQFIENTDIENIKIALVGMKFFINSFFNFLSEFISLNLEVAEKVEKIKNDEIINFMQSIELQRDTLFEKIEKDRDISVKVTIKYFRKHFNQDNYEINNIAICRYTDDELYDLIDDALFALSDYLHIESQKIIDIIVKEIDDEMKKNNLFLNKKQ